MLTCIPHDLPAPSPDADDVRTALGPLATDGLMEAVDHYIPTPDVTGHNPPPTGGS
ncbi:MAG: hypothetical protein ABJF88_05645 [Rhodothermales bacterium]